MRQDGSSSRIKERVWSVARAGAVRVIGTDCNRCVRVEERSAQRREHRSVVPAICFDAGFESAVELRELSGSREARESGAQCEWKRGSTGVERRQSVIEKRRDRGEYRGFGYNWSWIVRGTDIHIEGCPEVITRVDYVQEVECLDGLRETLNRRLLRRR